MNKNKSAQINGEKWTRAKELVFQNPLGRNPQVIIHEQDAIDISGVETTIETHAKIHRIFTQENALTEFPLLNPITGEELGSTATYQDIQVMLYSFYIAEHERRYNPPIIEDEGEEDAPIDTPVIE